MKHPNESPEDEAIPKEADICLGASNHLDMFG